MQGAAPAPAAAIAGPRTRELERLSATLNASPALQRLQAMRPAGRTGLPAQLRASVVAMSGVSLARAPIPRNASRPPLQRKYGARLDEGPGPESQAGAMDAPASGAVAPVSAAPLRDHAAVVQRKVGDTPMGAFDGTRRWANWFAQMTESEVAQQADKLGLTKKQLNDLNLGRRKNNLIPIPAAYALPTMAAGFLPAVQSPASAATAKPSALLPPAQVSLPQISASASPAKPAASSTTFVSPMKVNLTPAPADVSKKVLRSRRVARQSQASPIQWLIVTRQLPSKKYDTDDNRHKSLSAMPPNILDECYKLAEKAFKPDPEVVKEIYGNYEDVLAIELEPQRYVHFFLKDPELLGEELAVLYDIRHQEPEPRSGAARAADDKQAGKERARRDPEAQYDAATTDIGSPKDYEDYVDKNASSKFTSTMSGGTIYNTITHYRPWAKGDRTPGQSTVMGGQNAKNYYFDFMHPGRADDPLAVKRAAFAAFPGRFEWLHIIGSSLGGPNVIGNLVCGTYDANTEMIALEHRVANWGTKAYSGEFKPSTSDPIKIVGEAKLKGKGFVASDITLSVSHGTTPVMTRSYPVLKNIVITKQEYEKAEKGIGVDVEKARAKLAPASATKLPPIK